MGLFKNAIKGNDEKLVREIDVDHGLWRALRTRDVLTEEQLEDCENQVCQLFVLVFGKW